MAKCLPEGTHSNEYVFVDPRHSQGGRPIYAHDSKEITLGRWLHTKKPNSVRTAAPHMPHSGTSTRVPDHSSRTDSFVTYLQSTSPLRFDPFPAAHRTKRATALRPLDHPRGAFEFGNSPLRAEGDTLHLLSDEETSSSHPAVSSMHRLPHDALRSLLASLRRQRGPRRCSWHRPFRSADPDLRRRMRLDSTTLPVNGVDRVPLRGACNLAGTRRSTTSRGSATRARVSCVHLIHGIDVHILYHWALPKALARVA